MGHSFLINNINNNLYVIIMHNKVRNSDVYIY